MKLFVMILVSVLAMSLPGQANAATKELVQAQLLADVSSIQPGQSFTIGILLKIEPGWHIYWKNPGDAGLATKVEFILPEGFTAGKLQYPVPMRFDQPGGLIGYGYKDEVMLLTTVTPPEQPASASPITLTAKTSWLCCEKVCIPGKADLTMQLPTSDKPAPANEELFRIWKRQIPTPAGEDKNFTSTSRQANGYTELTLQWNNKPAKVELFPMPPDNVTLKDLSVEHRGRETRIRWLEEWFAGTASQAGFFPGVIAHVDANGQRRGVQIDLPLGPSTP